MSVALLLSWWQHDMLHQQVNLEWPRRTKNLLIGVVTNSLSPSGPPEGAVELLSDQVGTFHRENGSSSRINTPKVDDKQILSNHADSLSNSPYRLNTISNVT